MRRNATRSRVLYTTCRGDQFTAHEFLTAARPSPSRSRPHRQMTRCRDSRGPPRSRTSRCRSAPRLNGRSSHASVRESRTGRSCGRIENQANLAAGPCASGDWRPGNSGGPARRSEMCAPRRPPNSYRERSKNSQMLLVQTSGARCSRNAVASRRRNLTTSISNFSLVRGLLFIVVLLFPANSINNSSFPCSLAVRRTKSDWWE